MCAGLSPSPVRARVLVAQKSGTGSDGSSAPHSRSGACAASVRLPADLGLTPAERVAGQPERVRRWYRLDGLQWCRWVQRRKHMVLHPGPAPVPGGPQERWSRDFVYDVLHAGRPYRSLTVVDQWSRSRPVLEAGFRMAGEIVSRVFDRGLGDRPAVRLARRGAGDDRSVARGR